MKIILERVEGFAHECTRETFDNFAAATVQINRWARTAPDGGAYDKTDCEVYLSDDLAFHFRLDLQRKHAGADFHAHALEVAKFYAGLRCPSHFSPEGYEHYLREHLIPGRRETYVRIVAELEKGAL
jgi:hypothetical protein